MVIFSCYVLLGALFLGLTEGFFVTHGLIPHATQRHRCVAAPMKCMQHSNIMPWLPSSSKEGMWRSQRVGGHLRYTPISTFKLKSSLTSTEDEKSLNNNKKFGMSKKLLQRWITGLSLGALGTLWIISGRGIFTFGFFLTSFLTLQEYYGMVSATGVSPTTKTGISASIISYLSAAFFPSYHEMIMPLSVIFLMVWLLIFNKKSASIGEISTSLLGMYYIGYLPSFWVRLRGIDNKLVLYTDIFKNQAWMHVDWWTIGSFMTWWTWTSIVLADVSAYFVGKNFGKTKLSRFSSAAGSASPNKTIEGAIAGILGCMIFNTVGAYLMRWPFWPGSGALYGCMIGFIALVGDLTASMMKRDAGFKDSGTILPGHGGLLDRIDSYMLTAPASYFFISGIVKLLTATK